MQPVNPDIVVVEAFATDVVATHSRVKESSVWSAYYELTKPGITKMVVLSASAGYYLSLSNPLEHFSRTSNVANLILTVVGTTLVAAGSCAFNNYIERDYDKLMKRTMKRPIPSGRLTPWEALMFGIGITFTGIAMLVFVNWLTVILAVATWFSYVVVYTPLKRKTTWSLLVGGIPGAIPTIGGWVAATGSIGLNGVVFFFILFFWQMPHFLSLSWIYKEDYARGGFKMLAVLDESGKVLARHTIGYIIALTIVTLMLPYFGAVGYIYALCSTLLCGNFMYFAIRMLNDVTPANARKVLMSSYLYLMGVIILIFADKV